MSLSVPTFIVTFGVTITLANWLLARNASRDRELRSYLEVRAKEAQYWVSLYGFRALRYLRVPPPPREEHGWRRRRQRAKVLRDTEGVPRHLVQHFLCTVFLPQPGDQVAVVTVGVAATSETRARQQVNHFYRRQPFATGLAQTKAVGAQQQHHALVFVFPDRTARRWRDSLRKAAKRLSARLRPRR